MKPLRREDILDFETYGDRRELLRAAALRAKERRRVHLGGVLTLLFENRETVRHQVHEMVRVERLVREAAILHELETYNELLGGPGELGATLLIEIDDEQERDRKLRQWLRLPAHLHAILPDGRRVPPRHDPRQVGEDRVSAVQFLRFPVEGQVPEAFGCDLPGLELRTELSAEQRAALAEDLASDGEGEPGGDSVGPPAGPAAGAPPR